MGGEMAIRTRNDAQRAIARAVVEVGSLKAMTYDEVAARSGVLLGHVRAFLDEIEGLARHVDGRFTCGPDTFHLLQAVVEQPLDDSPGPTPLSIALNGNHNVVQASGRDLAGHQAVATTITYRQALEQLQQAVSESRLPSEKKRDVLGRIAELAIDKVIAPILGAVISKQLGE
jgi:hypothetical protein